MRVKNNGEKDPMYAQPQPPEQPTHALHRRPVRRVRLQSPWLILAGVFTLGTVAMICIVGLLVLVLYSGGKQIPSGVAVAGIPIGGESVKNATGQLTQHDFASQPVILTDGDRRWTLSLGELGIQVDVAATIQAAQDAPAGTAVQPWYTIDFTQTQNILIAFSPQVNIAATPGQAGRSIDIPAVLDRLYLNLQGELADGVLELSMIVTDPLPQTTSSSSSTPYTGQTTVHVVEQGQELGLIAKLYNVSLQDIINLNQLDNPDLLYVGQELTIPAAGVYTPAAVDAPAAPTSVGKAIVVSTSQQRIYAYENGQMVRSDLVSTGLPDTPTVLGDYKVYQKYTATDMSGPGYYLPAVPYTMYFYEGYGIHGTYWHNSFGRPMSHGCVNLPTPEAEWFFNWAEVGTPVRVV